MFRNFNRKGQKGFTLIEAVVAAGVFAFVVTSSLGVYLAIIRLDSRSRAEREVQQNARFIIDYLSKEIRNGSVDYGSTNNSHMLSVINQLDQSESFQWNGASGDPLILTKSGLGATNLNSSKVLVTNFAVSVSPSSNPFVLANGTDIQPHVTIVMTLKSANQRAGEAATMNIQSTFAVRQYPARQ